MIRVVFAVVITIALIGVSLPAMDHGASVRTDEHLRTDLVDVERAAIDLLANDEIPPAGEPGARRSVPVTVPERSLTWAAVDYVAIGGSLETDVPRDHRQYVLAYRVSGRSESIVHLQVPIRPATGDGEPLVLRGSGDHDLLFTLERTDDSEGDDGAIVVVRRA